MNTKNKDLWRFIAAIFVISVFALALTGTASASNVPADYPTIQQAIDNATAGETINVTGGPYQENIVIDEEVTLLGISLPVIDGMGGTAINITAANVTVDGFNITNCSYGIKSTALGFTIVNNIINASVDGIHLYLHDIGRDLTGTESYAIGNSTIYNNVINATNNGIYLNARYWGYNLTSSAVVDLGAVTIMENTIGCQDGISLDMDYLGSYLAGYANFTWDGLMITGNIINADDDGIYAKIGCLAYYNADFSQAHFGYVQFNDNRIHAGNDTVDSYGIYIYELEELGSYMYQNAYVEFGNWEVVNNTINSTDDGIYLYCYENGAYMYDFSNLSMGNFQFNDNVIVSESDGIYLGYWYYNGYGMNDFSYAEFGNFEIKRNNITALDYGIYVYPYECGSCLYDNSTFVMGDWLINDNEIQSDDEGIYFYSEYFGYDMYDSSNASIGSLEIINNTINSTGGDGIESWWWYHFGASLYENAYVEVGDCLIRNNTITTSSDCGIYTGPYAAGYYVYDDAQAYFGDYVVANNDIFANGTYGIYFYYYELGNYLKPDNFDESQAIVEFGDALINDNNITAPNGYGIYFDGYYVGAYLYDNSSVTTDNIQINGNTIASFDDSLYIVLDNFGYDLYNYSAFTMGNITHNDNTITITNSGRGIYLYTSDFLTDVYDNASASRGYLLLDGNIISNASYGIYLDETDNATISNNTVHDNEHGIYLDASSNNTLEYNTIANNTAADTGAHVDELSNDNELHLNCFYDNVPQALDYGTGNDWTGNFWSDWSGSGPYSIEEGSEDSNPLDECPLGQGPPPAPVQAPVLTPTGIIALVGLLSVIAAISIRKRR